MKKYFYIAFLFLSLYSSSQNVFWNETFGSGCNVGQYANGFSSSNGSWSAVATGTQGTYPNNWFVSATEAGMGVGNCGDGCSNTPSLTNSTLHMGVDVFPGFQDFGASYLAGPGYESDNRVQSPLINCSAQTNITLSFLYILGGIPGTDYMEVHYSANGGTTWSVIATPPPTNNSVCVGQGLWTNYTLTLPASANANPNVKIGFRWVNTDANGTDPSAAIDNIQLSTPGTFTPLFTLNSPACVNSSQTLTANTGTYAVSGYSWTTSPSGPQLSAPNASATAITFTNSGTFTVTLTATSGTTTASTSHTVFVGNPSPITAMSNPNIGCAGQQFTLSASGAGISSYTWNPGNLTGASVVITPTLPGQYTVTGSNGICTSTANTSVGMYNTPFVNASSSSSVICSGNTATLTASGASSYTWNPGNLTGTSIVVSPTITVTYTVTGSNGFCTNTKTVSLNVSTCTGVSKATANETGFILYPNPASDKLQIVSAQTSDAIVEITDALGKVIMTEAHAFKAGDTAHTVNITAFPTGMYLVKITSSNASTVIRFIKG